MSKIKELVFSLLSPIIRLISKAISKVEKDDVLKGLRYRGERIEIYGKITIENKNNVSIGDFCTFNEGIYISGHGPVHIGNNVSVSAGAMIITAYLDYEKLKLKRKSDIHGHKPVVIGNNSQLGAGSIILPGVVVGDNVIVGAGSVVTKDVPNNNIVAGVPAKIIKKIS